MIIKLRIYHQKCKLLIYNVKKIEQRTECFRQTETIILMSSFSLFYTESFSNEGESLTANA